jgi:hypothetical protein
MRDCGGSRSQSLSYQGIADRVAYDYMQRHGRITWRDIEQSRPAADTHRP